MADDVRRLTEAELAEGLRLVGACREGGPGYWGQGALTNAACRNYGAALAELTAARAELALLRAVESRLEVMGWRLEESLGALETSNLANEHSPPGDCWATGPLKGYAGDHICIGCEAIRQATAAITVGRAALAGTPAAEKGGGSDGCE